MNLLPAINLLKKQISEKEKQTKQAINGHKEIIQQIEKQMISETGPLKVALEELRRSNTVCEYCEGKGLERYTDAAGDTDSRDCRYCNGTGKAIDK
jgi:DnaJ-class molecular chaperone